jgi:translation initiation factor IF-2
LSKTIEKVRVYILAKELALETKDMLELCKELGYEGIKNQLTGLEPEQVAGLKKRIKEGPKHAPAAKPALPKPGLPAALPKGIDTKVRTIAAPAKPKAPARPADEAHVPEGEVGQVTEAPPTEPEAAEPFVAAEANVVAPAPAPMGPPPASMMPSNMPTQSRGVQSLLNPNRMPSVGNRPSGPSGPRPTNAPHRPTTTPPTVPHPPSAVPHPQPHPVATQTAPPPNVGPPKLPTQAPPQQQRQNPGAPQQLPGQAGPSGPPRPTAPVSGPTQAPTTRSTNPFARPPRANAGGMPSRNPMAGGNPMQARPPGGPGKAPAVAPPASKSMKLTVDQIKKLREMEQKRGKVSMDQVQKQITTPTADAGSPEKDKPKDASGRPVRPALPRPDDSGESDEDKKKKLPGAVAGRDGRHASRQGRDRKASTDKGAVIIGAGGQVDVIEQAAGSRRGPRAALLAKMKRRNNQQIIKKEGPVEIALPITVRSLSEAIGMKVGDLSKQLLAETQKLFGVNSVVEFDAAEIIAINKGITLVAKRVLTAEDLLLEGFEKRAREVDPELLRPRPPVVTIMGHVDHGKTSLLDKIRAEYGHESNVVDTEAGGITQVLRAWRVEKDGKPVTFLDTPGHEAFTMMRARGAKVTDIVVIVVAATDGVMPQTEEAINHALAADVEIIVAINKIDMPNANIDKTRRQLYQLNLLPDNMGGDVPFVETSAITGQGIGELLDAIAVIAELAEYKADPSHPASGTCLEAYLDADHGVMATLLVQQGTLHKGDVILCGSSHGRVRAMFDDLGQPIEEAGPSMPVKIFGLDPVPDADDPFYAVDDVATAASIAGKRADRTRERSLVNLSPKSLDQLKEANAKIKITELKIILKAEARGSIEAIKRELEKLTHEEIRCRLLHSGVGAISESDVTLALTSPQDTLVIGFNVTADDAALRLANERGISLREYDIIYKLVEDVTAALEGRLKPIEEVVHLGRAVVREAFRITKVGVVAGCYVTQGVIERSARVRVIRDGTVIYPPSEKTLGLDSLKRFKDDAKEVKEGYECGLKIVGFEDVKVGDVIEAFRIEIKMRKL